MTSESYILFRRYYSRVFFTVIMFLYYYYASENELYSIRQL